MKNFEVYESNESEGFDKIEGYTLEVFESPEEMYSRMEEIRKANSNEAHGFVARKSSKIGFYYQVGDSEISTEFPPNIENSWHSHPDSNISEVIFKEEDLPPGVSDEVRTMARSIVDKYTQVEQVSSNKISLMDIINILGNERSEDLISLPGGILLSLNYPGSENTAMCRKYANLIDQYWKNLVGEAMLKLTEENQNELRLSMTLRYYDYAISEFINLLDSLGYEKMTVENYAEILNKIGLLNSIYKV
ncbi:MAG: hypothetical protein V4690_01385 [Patescibacteria group bacterium]